MSRAEIWSLSVMRGMRATRTLAARELRFAAVSVASGFSLGWRLLDLGRSKSTLLHIRQAGTG